jgi:hypothetical protein
VFSGPARTRAFRLRRVAHHCTAANGRLDGAGPRPEDVFVVSTVLVPIRIQHAPNGVGADSAFDLTEVPTELIATSTVIGCQGLPLLFTPLVNDTCS